MKKDPIIRNRLIKWHDLVFSERPQQRYLRHVLFWLAWWVYFACSLFYALQGLQEAGSFRWIWIVFLKSMCLLPCHALMTYMVIYFLLPAYLLKARYIFFITGLLVTGAVAVTWSYFCYALLFVLLDTVFQLPSAIGQDIILWNSITAGLLSALKVVMAATSIKLLKRWWLKQKEKERLEKEKFNAELQLLKAQIHPDLLFKTLDYIYAFAQSDAARASELLLKLSELLSYMLYECDQAWVPLEKELKMITDYILMQKIRIGQRLEIDISIQGDAPGRMIAPLLLLPFIENGFSFCDNEKLEKAWINVDLQITENYLSLKLVNGIPPDLISSDNENANRLANVQRRLEMIYPGYYELKTTSGDEIMMTFLKIQWTRKETGKTEGSIAMEHSGTN